MTKKEQKRLERGKTMKFPEMLYRIDCGFVDRYKFSAMVGGCKETAFYLKDDRVVIIVKFESINKANTFDDPVKAYNRIKKDFEYHLRMVDAELKRLNEMDKP